jgi:methyltransferase-like protein/precorrin-6B methylase 2
MSITGRTTYDQVPYDTKPRYATHPDCQATLATLLGMKPAPVDRCRVLEIGCGTGGNLFPLAEAHPESQFVGIDLSDVQIQSGRKVAAALGMDNLRLEAKSITDVGPDFGEFDYIICHGVYSWVPPEVREKILSICKHNLAPQGVAYVSYNTYPGWYLRAGVRDMMNFHVGALTDPKKKIEQARALLQFAMANNPEPQGTWQKVLRDEAEVISPVGDFYLFHEHLEEHNYACYFHEFMSRAMLHGLQYLGEAHGHTSLAVFDPKVQETLRKIAPDLLYMEQYLDFLRNRAFRMTLLVHAEVELNRSPGPSILEGLLMTGSCRPRSESPEVASEKVEEFENQHGSTVSTNHPFTKAALVVLWEKWPRPFTFAELWETVRGRLGESAAGMPAEKGRGMLASSLVQLYLSGLVELHMHVPEIALKPSERPYTTKLIRLQAMTGATNYNRRHKLVNVSVMQRAVLALCDGTRDRAAMVEALAEKVRNNELGVARDGRELTDDEEIKQALRDELEECLTRLADGMLLVS